MCQPKYSFWYPTSTLSNHQLNMPYGIQISNIVALQWTHGISIPQPWQTAAGRSLPGYHHTSPSYSDTIDTGSKTHAYTKESTGIYNGVVHVTLLFDNVTAKPNVIRLKYPDENISQATHSALLKLQFLPVEERRVRFFDTHASGSLLSLVKLCDAGCIAYFNVLKFYLFFREIFPPRSHIRLHYLPVET